VRSSLLELSVDFGGFDLREQLSSLDMRANVKIPALEITTGSRIDRCIAECLRIAGQDDFLCWGSFLRKNHGHGWNRGLFGSLFESRFGCYSRMDAGVNHESESSEHGRGEKDCGSALGYQARVKPIGIRLHGLRFDHFWFAGGCHILIARCHWFSFNSC